MVAVGVFSVIAGGGGEEVPSNSVRSSSMVACVGEEGLSVFGAGDDCLELVMTAGVSESADESFVSSLEFVFDDEDDDDDDDVQLLFFLNKKMLFWCH
jgi:hypothetical protein